MKTLFQDIQSYLDENKIQTTNKNLNEIIKNYKYYFFITNDPINISKQKIEEILKIYQESFYPVIFISEYLDNQHENQIGFDLFQICFENTLILIKQSEIQQFSQYFTNNQKEAAYVIYTKSDQTGNKIAKAFNCKLPFSTEEENHFFKEEISSFCEELNIQIKHTNKNIEKNKILFKWLFIEPISGYLIKKGYYKTNHFDRVENCHYFSKTIKDNSIIREDYKILRKIGGQNNIYLIYHIEQQKLFVMKIFIGEKADVLFKREHQNYLNIQHPFFPLYFGTAEYFEYDTIVIEYINGKTIDKIELSQNDKIKIIFQLLVGIDYLHSNGYIYRDLKPDNIMIIKNNKNENNNNYSIVIIDLDRMISDSDSYKFTRDFEHEFIAPEIVLDEPFSNKENPVKSGKNKTFSNKADIFSIGQIISFLFSEQLKSECSLKLLFDECTNNDESKRPNIQQLIEKYYINFFSTITPINERNSIKILNDFHDDLFGMICFYISEYNHPESQLRLGLLHRPDKLETKILVINEYAISINKNQTNLHTLNESVKEILGIDKYISQNIEKSIHYLSLAADQNYPQAQVVLGMIFIRYDYITKDANKVIHYLTLASNYNVPYIQYTLGLIYLSGEYITQDINKAIYYLTLASNQGCKYANYTLGVIFYKAKYVTLDINKAIHYFTLAADQNYECAQHDLGKIYYMGEYIERDINRAIHYLTLASNKGYKESQYLLGVIFYEAKYVKRDIKKAIHYFTLASNQNHPFAHHELGATYYNGIYVARDINKAIYYFTLASNQGCKYTDYTLGVIFYKAKYVTRDINKAIHYFTLAADQNYECAQHALGKIYYKAKYVARDMNKAIHYLTLASNQNYSKSQYILGKIYSDGEYITRDMNKAIHYLLLASNQNDGRAQYTLGYIYYIGEYIERDINKAIHYFTLASNQNHPFAHHELGATYYNGVYVARDINKAIYYFTLASNQNILESQRALGQIYLDGEYIIRDISKAIHYFTLAANQNNASAQYNLGVIYYFGYYIDKDINKAIYYFTLASNQKNSKAQYFLGTIFYIAKYVTRDMNKAIHYFTLASNQKDSRAQYALGEIYYYGQYFVKDITKAIYYFTLASNQNHKESLCMLGKIYYLGKDISRDVKKAIHYLILASNQNDPDAQHALGLIYFYGNYIKHDISKAIYYFTLSANQNIPESQCYLGFIYYNLNKNKSLNYYMTAAQNNDSKAQFIIGYFYLTGQNVTKNTKEALKYFTKAANNKLYDANFFIGSIYLKGDEVDRNIDLSIHYYKESSSFDQNYSKNNLGIIYYNFKNAFAIEYFEEAIHQKNDYLSMYNLGHIYFYNKFGNQDLNKSIEFLYKSYTNGFYISFKLLCLVIYTKIKSFNIDYISKEIGEYGNDKNISEICDFIQNFKSESFYQNIYSNFKDIEFVYDYELKPAVLSSFINNAKKEKNEENSPKIQYPLTNDFYEGFGNKF